MPTQQKYEVTPGDASVDIRCFSASDFLHLLEPMRGLFSSPTFIFRGVSSDGHGLLPSAHRAGARLRLPSDVVVLGPLDSLRTQCGAEFYTIDGFFKIASRHGVHMPEDSYVLRQELDEWNVLFQQNDATPYLGRVWPSPRLFSLIALAQHYAIPTRALDWTYSAYVAAYFAARPALNSYADFICVWAVDDFHRQVDRVLAATAERPLQVFTVSGAENENLRAQRGLFMLHPQSLDEPFAPFRPTKYNALLLESLPLLKDAVQFIRILLDGSHARDVLGLLATAGITRGALYPGLSGVAQEFEEERLIPPRRAAPGGDSFETIGLWDRINEAARRIRT